MEESMDFVININLCRVCMKGDKGNSLIEDEDLKMKFLFTTQLTLHDNDNMPTIICAKCILRLKIAYDFVKLAQASEKNLKAFLAKINTDFQQVTKNNSFIDDASNAFQSKDDNDDDIVIANIVEDEAAAQLMQQQQQDKDEAKHKTASIDVLANANKISKPIEQNDAMQKNHIKKEEHNTLKEEQPSNVIEDLEEVEEDITDNETVETPFVVYDEGNDNFMINAECDEEENVIKNDYNERMTVKQLDIYEISDDCGDDGTRDSQMCEMEMLDDSSQQLQDDQEEEEEELNAEDDEKGNDDGYLKEYDVLLDTSSHTNSQSYIVDDSSAETMNLYENAENMQETDAAKLEESNIHVSNVEMVRTKSAPSLPALSTTPKPAASTRRVKAKKKVSHIEETDKNGTFYCAKCDRDFSTKTNLTRHLLTHEGKKPYECNICGRSFTQNGSLKQHLYTHSGEKPYMCEICQRGFTQSKSLVFHMRRHTGEKPFRCEKCLSYFRQKDGLKAHILKHHMFREQDGDNGETHTCVICQKVLTSKIALQTHMKKHINNHNINIKSNEAAAAATPSATGICNENSGDGLIYDLINILPPEEPSSSSTIWQADELRMHVTNVMGASASELSRVKKFQCLKCFKCFAIKENLIRHLSVHNDDPISEVFQCNNCSSSFDSIYMLKVHHAEKHKHRVFQSSDELNVHMNIADDINLTSVPI